MVASNSRVLAQYEVSDTCKCIYHHLPTFSYWQRFDWIYKVSFNFILVARQAERMLRAGVVGTGNL